MDPNLEYWQNNGKTFLSRLRIWLNILDPSSILSSDVEIDNARSLIRRDGNKLKDEKVINAWKLSLCSVHADTGEPISTVLRPQAFLPVSAPFVIASLMLHKGVTPALFWQFLLHGYCAGFNYANRNATATPEKKLSTKQSLLITGTVAYSTFAGALPQIIIKRLAVSSSSAQAFCRSVLPVPLSACLAAFSVFVVRSEESENGIKVFDSSGNPVGVSREAGYKAVKETAISRATLFGTTALVPNLMVLLLRRGKLAKMNPMMFAPVRHMSTAIVLGLMIPVSFSLFPQLGKIKKENVEKELQNLTGDVELYYHRGL
ncbi:sideroflexin-4 isoform X1 [Tachysurus fulvidraco]|uniref:sideroflexin-4 isoform X1 n=1 Tax=Tachysurus fulvidraco TaxID=1234273 RepID=UPI000F50CAB9|nr:sideroflexin-4 isoform X1 [Tachysurus fulvidraco]